MLHLFVKQSRKSAIFILELNASYSSADGTLTCFQLFRFSCAPF